MVDLVDRCFAYLDDDSTIEEVRQAVADAVALYWFSDELHMDLFLNPCLTLQCKDLSISFMLLETPDCISVPNYIYARLLTSLITSKQEVHKWKSVVKCGSAEIRVHLSFGVLVDIKTKCCVVPASFVKANA